MSSTSSSSLSSILTDLTDEELILTASSVLVVFLEEELYDAEPLRKELDAEERRRNIKQRRLKEPGKRKFSQVIGYHFSDETFGVYFRMKRDSFFTLCSTICTVVGERDFKPEESIDLWNKQYGRGALLNNGGTVPGEVRVAIFIRILAGASYLELMDLFDLSSQPIFQSFHTVCGWMNKTFKYPLMDALETEDVNFFEEVSYGFAHSASNGVFHGCIGALDGMAIRIKKPIPSETMTIDPYAYHCRKNLFVLNCQGICDANKKFLWLSPHHVGSCHDSVAFKETPLYDLLQKKKGFLRKNGFFLVSDSSYDMESFLLVSFGLSWPDSVEDTYNYYHSNCRIHIDCAFGEMVMRWGILWRTMMMDPTVVSDIVSAAGLLHNFILDELGGESCTYITSFSEHDLERDPTHRKEVEIATPLVGDNNEVKPLDISPPTQSDIQSRDGGERLRRSLAWSLETAGLCRPRPSRSGSLFPGFKYNSLRITYME